MRTWTHDELVENNRHQVAEALGPDNRWFAGEYFGRQATDRECVLYYIGHGGAEGHRLRMEDNPPPASKVDS